MFFYLGPDDMKTFRNQTGIREKTLRNKINNERAKWISLKKKRTAELNI